VVLSAERNYGITDGAESGSGMAERRPSGVRSGSKNKGSMFARRGIYKNSGLRASGLRSYPGSGGGNHNSRTTDGASARWVLPREWPERLRMRKDRARMARCAGAIHAQRGVQSGIKLIKGDQEFDVGVEIEYQRGESAELRGRRFKHRSPLRRKKKRRCRRHDQRQATSKNEWSC